VFLVEHDDAGGYAGAVKQVGRQADELLREKKSWRADSNRGPADYEADQASFRHRPQMS
jgi:hypothetical protein